MPIEFQCPACKKGIRAPDAAGGKYAKCPYCSTSVYVPLPPAVDEEISLAPIDPKVEQARERLRQESISYAADVDHEQSPKYDVTPGAKGGARPAGREKPSAPSARDDEAIDVHELVEKFVFAMRDSNLSEADRICAKLRRRKDQTQEYVEGLMLDQIGLAVKGVPRPVVNGFLKSLLERL